MQRAKAVIDRVLEWVLIVLMGVMVVNVLWQVFSRYVLNDPSSFTDELARFLLIWLGFLAAAYGVSKRFHLAIDLFVKARTGRSKIYTQIFIECCVLFFAVGLMIYGGIQLVGTTLYLEQISAALQIQLGYVYIVMPIAGALIVFYNIAYLMDRFRLLRDGAVDPEDDSGDLHVPDPTT